MNKQSYRIVFNQSRSCLMAVAETATSQGKSAHGERAGGGNTSSSRTFTAIAWACKLLGQAVFVSTAALSLTPFQTQAQTVATRIVADPSAPRAQQATVLSTGNGVVQVNIQTPSSAGVSRNTYTQFDVGSQGAILNNSRTNVQTQQGGWVQGNPWLATGSARVILNEVNSTNPSQLQGYVEVAGQRAEVVIANPAGIAVSGAGFINASGVTLTTGTPVVNNGNLDSYRVQRGAVSVDGQGLDTRTADYTAVLARAAQINAGIWAKQLQVVTGANEIQTASMGADTTPQTTALAGSGNLPAYALDVAQLGGMYAGKITLIGTEAGLGVRNAGLVQASSGPLTLTHEGWLSNSGTLQATGGDVRIQTRGTVEQSGTVYSDKNVQLTSQSSQTHSGTVAALGDASIKAMGIQSNDPAAHIAAASATVWAAGLKADGQLTGQQNLQVQASGQVQTAGKAFATDTLSMQGASLDLSQSIQQAPTLKLQATTGNLQASGSQILATGMLQLQTTQALITDSANVQAGTLSIQANRLSNVAGHLIQTGTADQSIALQGGLDNSAGVIQTNANNLAISAQSVDNTAGQLLHAGSGTFSLSSQAQLTNNTQSSTQHAVTDGARIASSGSLNITSGDMGNSGSVYAAKDLTATAASLNNSGTLYAADGQTLTVTNAISSSGTIAAAKDLGVTATSFSGSSTSVLAAGMAADGRLTGTGSLTLNTTSTLQSAGQVLSTGNVTLEGSSLDLRGTTMNGSTTASVVGSTAGDLRLTASAGDIQTSNAQLNTPGLLAITANSNTSQMLDNHNGQLSAAQLDIRSGQLNNSQGQILQTATGVRTASIQTAGAITNASGTIIANAQDFTLSAGGQLNNTDGQIGHAGAGTFTLNTAASDNTRGKILGNGTLQMTATGDVNNTSGLVAAQSLDVNATGWNNSQGKLLSTQTDLSLHTSQNAVTNTGGLIQSAQDLSLSLNGAGNNLQNSQGKIYAGRNATLSTGVLTNDTALIAAGRNLGIDTHGQSLSNLGSRNTNTTSTPPLGLIAGGQMDVTSGALDNRAGLISAQGALNLTSTGTVNNAAHNGQASQIYSGASLNLQAAGVENTASQILAVQNANINTGMGSLTNTTGLVRVGQTLTVQAASVVNSDTRAFNRDGSPQAMGLEGQTVALTTANLNNTQGAVRAAQDLAIQSDGQLSNDQGELSAGRHLQITTATAATPTLHISNAAGQIVADASVSVTAGSLSGAGNQAKQPQTNAILEQVQANPKPISITPSTDQATKLQDQVGKDNNAQMNKLLTAPIVPLTPSASTPQVPSTRLDQLNQFKLGQ